MPLHDPLEKKENGDITNADSGSRTKDKTNQQSEDLGSKGSNHDK